MYRIFALTHAKWRTASSYRLRMIISIVSLSVSAIPIYFIANALQSTMENSIQGEGGHYFAFLIVGGVTLLLIDAAVDTMPDEVSSGINNGTLDALLGTPSHTGSILGGLMSYELLWTVARGTLLVLVGSLLGVNLFWSNMIPAVLILGLIVLAYLPIGMMATAMVIAFRTTGPFPQAILTLSALLGGVYYSTSVIPTWLQGVSAFIPLTYGLRALRGTLLEGLPISAVASDVAILAGFVLVLTGIGIYSLSLAFTHARRAGTLAHY